ncbi:type II secretion system protein GspD [Jeongeupia naejangsanensis]|uniref:Secretin N-terminal domain-containing protein n=1 Tax=Jeongeupia naejangsanensis TaxID=613195 RepID=A0ABS2BK08_9NEIS|nr:secretin N-terminal domain-containing protein [Jeongeupia naejangsanensis]MBM3115952.1 secretin N-terminal domain-containing protein [Jeongeupia naejangsanensis]
MLEARRGLWWGLLATLSGCAGNTGLTMAPERHLSVPATPPSAAIPPTISGLPPLPRPRPAQKTEVYSVVVHKLPLAELLFALGRDAKINVDVSPDVSGVITLNAINQTLPQIMARVARQADIRWTLDGGVLSVTPDTPYLKTYAIDYMNVSRTVKSSVNILNSVSSVSGNSTTSNGTTTTQSSAGDGGNTSSTQLEMASEHQFWRRLEGNLKVLLGITDAAANVPSPAQQAVTQLALSAPTTPQLAQQLAQIEKSLAQAGKAQAETANLQARTQPPVTTNPPATIGNQVIVHPETGMVTVRASHKDQQRVAEMLAAVQASASRQVLIEATIVEVALSNEYQAGVDWSRVATNGVNFAVQNIGTALAQAPFTAVSYSNPNHGFDMTVKLLEQFGRTRVLSSPKIIALNNQTALMKVVEEQVYFTISQQTNQNDSQTVTNLTSTLNTVPVGLVMQVTPQVAEDNTISLNVRPTITNISGYVADPAVALLAAQSKVSLQSLVPVLQVREFDSTLKVPSGQIAVLGGLIQDALDAHRSGIPGVGRVPVVGDLFSYRDDKVRKIELVVFLRPVTVRNASVDGDLAGLKGYLPANDFFESPQDQTLSAYQGGLTPMPVRDER